jgi:hypothetical protein
VVAYFAYDPLQDIPEYWDDVYAGHWGSLEEYAEDFYEEIYGPFDVPGFTISVNRPDWEQDYLEVDAAIGGVYLYRTNV